MSTDKTDMMHRRDFLLLAASAVGTTALIGRTEAACDSPNDQSTQATNLKTFCLAFWDGERFVVPAEIQSTSLKTWTNGAKITVISDETHDPVITALDILYPVGGASAAQWLPHLAWTRNPLKLTKSVVNCPVVEDGVRFVVHHQEESSYCRLSFDGGNKSARLASGIYVIVPERLDWSGLQFEPDTSSIRGGTLTHRIAGRVAQVDSEYLTLGIEPA